MCSLRKIPLKISKNSLENTCEFGETFKNNIFYRAPTVAGFPLPEAVANQTSSFYKKYNTGLN